MTTAPLADFWYWISERHRIYLRRTAGEPKPWTTDPILQQYKFTNAFRQLDRGTVWLTENFLKPHQYPIHYPLCLALDDAPGIKPEDCDCGVYWRHLGLLAGNICWYRMYNWWGTGELLGWQMEWQPYWVKTKLHEHRNAGGQVFTGAHIVYSRPGLPKIDAITDVCTNLWELRQEVVQVARDMRSLESVFDLLTTVDCVGGFMAYEMVSDMRWTRLLEDATDILTWANPGPGAVRGLQRLQLPSHPRDEAINSMRWLLNKSRVELDGDIPDLEMREIEHSLCEFDKYVRVRSGEGKPRGTYPGVA